MADHELHHTSKKKLSEAILEAKRSGKAKGSWFRLIEKSGVSAATWHKATSLVCELENGRSKINTKSLQKIALALGLDENYLVDLVGIKESSK